MLKSRGSVHWPRGAAVRAGDVGQAVLRRPALARLELLLEVVGAEALVAVQALGQRVGEDADVTGGHPDLPRQDHRGVEADDVVPALDDGAPPLPLDVLLELDAEGPVVPGGAGAAVDLAGREDEAPALAEVDDLVEAGGVVLGGRRGRSRAATRLHPAGGRRLTRPR